MARDIGKLFQFAVHPPEFRFRLHVLGNIVCRTHDRFNRAVLRKNRQKDVFVMPFFAVSALNGSGIPHRVAALCR